MHCGSTRWARVVFWTRLNLQAAIFAAFSLVTFCGLWRLPALVPDSVTADRKLILINRQRVTLPSTHPKLAGLALSL